MALSESVLVIFPVTCPTKTSAKTPAWITMAVRGLAASGPPEEQIFEEVICVRRREELRS